MSFFPTTRLGRAVVLAVVVSGVAVVLPFLLAVVKMTGDVTTELPPLEPEGTPTAVLLANPVAWFLAVTATAWIVLAIADVVRLVGRRRAAVARPAARRPAPRKAAARKAAPRKPGSRPAPARTSASTRTTARKPAARPAARSATRTATRSPARPKAQQRPASRR